MYTTSQAKFESNSPRSLLVIRTVPEILRILFVFFFIAQNALAEKHEHKQPSCDSCDYYKFGTTIVPSLAYLFIKFLSISTELKKI